MIKPTKNPKKNDQPNKKHYLKESNYNINNNKRKNKQQLCSHKNFIC